MKFENVLAEFLTALEANEVQEHSRILKAHPEFASELASFLRTNGQIQDALGERGDDGQTHHLKSRQLRTTDDRSLDDTTGPVGDQRSFGGSTIWTLGNLSDQQFPIDFGDYVLLREIARGGMGVVFQAKHKNLGRNVALKVMRSGELASTEELLRFRAEAEASAVIRHPNIVPIFEVADVRGLVYFTMAYIDGKDLGTIVKERELTMRDSARILSKVAGAVSTAHSHGVIHRDIKPSNILLDAQGEPYLIDFGLAKLTERAGDITHTGQILGTPAYMPPEQASGRVRSLLPHTDVYSLGAVLYAMVTRQAPFDGPTPFDVLLQVISTEPPAPRKLNKKVPRDLEKIISRAMEKDPNNRYRTAEELRTDLQLFLVGEPIIQRRPPIIDRVRTWWRRESLWASHLCAIGFVLGVVVVARLFHTNQSTHVGLKILLLSAWLLACFALQRMAFIARLQQLSHFLWAILDVAFYTALIYFADPPRGLLLVGYPMMIAASGLFYRVRYVLSMTPLCILGFALLWATVSDPAMQRVDFCVIYISGLVVMGLLVLSMVRRIRSLSEYDAERRPEIPKPLKRQSNSKVAKPKAEVQETATLQ